MIEVEKNNSIRVYEITELEKLFDVKEYTLRQYIRAKKLKARKMGKKWYVSSEALREFFLTWEGEDLEEDE